MVHHEVPDLVLTRGDALGSALISYGRALDPCRNADHLFHNRTWMGSIRPLISGGLGRVVEKTWKDLLEISD
jgi:hypothetical protein